MFYNEKKTRSSGKANRLVVKETPGKLWWAHVHNFTGGDLWLQIHDLAGAAAPAGAAAAWAPTRIPANSFASIGFGEKGFPCDNGIQIVLSTTDVTYGAAGASDGHFTATYT